MFVLTEIPWKLWIQLIVIVEVSIPPTIYDETVEGQRQ